MNNSYGIIHAVLILFQQIILALKLLFELQINDKEIAALYFESLYCAVSAKLAQDPDIV